MRAKASSRAFVALSGLGLATEGVAAWLAYDWGARSLPCSFAPARALFGSGNACPLPAPLVGGDDIVPAALCGVLVVASLALFLVSFTGAAIATLRAERFCARRRDPSPLPATAMSAFPGCDLAPQVPKWLVVVPDVVPVAYCLGLFQPRVVVSKGLLEHLDGPSLKAVLEHEGSHRRRRDPLRHVLAKSLARALFMVPSLRDLADATLAEHEASADARAVSSAGRKAVVTALLQMVTHPHAPSGAAAMAAEDILRFRIKALESGEHPKVRLRPERLAESGLGLLLTLGAGVWLAASPYPRHFVVVQPHVVTVNPKGSFGAPSPLGPAHSRPAA